MPDLSGISGFLRGFMTGDTRKKQEILEEMRGLVSNISTMTNVQQMQQQMKLSQAAEGRTAALFPSVMKTQTAEASMAERKNIQEQKTIESYEKLISDLDLPQGTTPQSMIDYLATAEGQQRIQQIKAEQGLRIPELMAEEKEIGLKKGIATGATAIRKEEAAQRAGIPEKAAEQERLDLQMAIDKAQILTDKGWPLEDAIAQIDLRKLAPEVVRTEMEYNKARTAAAKSGAGSSYWTEQNKMLDAIMQAMLNQQYQKNMELFTKQYGTTEKGLQTVMDVQNLIQKTEAQLIDEKTNLEKQLEDIPIGWTDEENIKNQALRDEIGRKIEEVNKGIDLYKSVRRKQLEEVKILPSTEITKEEFLNPANTTGITLPPGLTKSKYIDYIVGQINAGKELGLIGKEILERLLPGIDREHGEYATYSVLRILENYAKSINDKDSEQVGYYRSAYYDTFMRGPEVEKATRREKIREEARQKQIQQNQKVKPSTQTPVQPSKQTSVQPIAKPTAKPTQTPKGMTEEDKKYFPELMLKNKQGGKPSESTKPVTKVTLAQIDKEVENWVRVAKSKKLSSVTLNEKSRKEFESQGYDPDVIEQRVNARLKSGK